jgi:hypothetical protein
MSVWSVSFLWWHRLSSSPEDQGLFRTKNLNDEEVLAAIQVEQVRHAAARQGTCRCAA